MRISELSERSGISVPTIKYYVREGLLHRGELTSPNQARYDESHLRRLRLVGALTEVGGLSVAATRGLLAEIDAGQTSTHNLLGQMLKSVDSVRDLKSQPDEEDLARVDALAKRHDWPVHTDSLVRTRFAQVLGAFRRLGYGPDEAWLDHYARAATGIAIADHDTLEGIADVDELLKQVVVGTVLGDSLLEVMRRMAQISESSRRRDT